MKWYAVFDKDGRHVDSVELQDNETPPSGAIEISEELCGHALRLDRGEPVLVTTRFYALFDADGAQLSQMKIVDHVAAPVGAVAIREEHFGQPLQLINGTPTARP